MVWTLTFFANEQVAQHPTTVWPKGAQRIPSFGLLAKVEFVKTRHVFLSPKALDCRGKVIARANLRSRGLTPSNFHRCDSVYLQKTDPEALRFNTDIKNTINIRGMNEYRSNTDRQLSEKNHIESN